MIRYDEHAEFQIAHRGISKEWIEQALLDPDEVEMAGRRRSCFKRLPGRRVMLRVVTPLDDGMLVITASFDRTKPCA